MKREIYLFEDNSWDKELDSSFDSQNTLIICFACSDYTKIQKALDDINTKFPNSLVIGCSTSGEIYSDELYEDSLSVAIMKFEKSSLKLNTLELNDSSDSTQIGKTIANTLREENLKSIFILSDGLNINGSKLTKGLSSNLEKEIIVTGGLAGDDARFEKTWVLVDGEARSNYITSVGFYGENINVASSSYGGWSNFGINRMVTESKDNVLYSLDGKPALEVYKTYLGDSAKDLPASGLLYPLMIKEEGYEESKVRTILAIDEEEQSITFAGDIPSNSEVMFMKASFSDLVNGASKASKELSLGNNFETDSLNIAISCVGRKLVLGQKTEDEIEAVLNNLSDNVKQIGYYSYGEISPLSTGECDLHNQTMTLTVISES
jgi:hypothetical protein